MKRFQKIRSKSILFSLMLLQCFGFGGQALAATYLGEFCWKQVDPDSSANFVLGRFGVTDIGDSHFTFNGSFTDFENNVPGNIDVAHGNAEIIDSTVLVTLVNSFFIPSEEYGFSMINFELDLATLDGTFKTIDTAHQFSSGGITEEFAEGPIEFVPDCQ